jgi:hypothetical protein
MTCPSATVMAAAAKIAIEQDRPIYLDYFSDSLTRDLLHWRSRR